MSNEEAVDIIRNEAACVRRADTCGRDCARCDLVREDTDILTAYEMAINALTAQGGK